MDALTLLHERRSMGKLTGPAPTAAQLDAIYRAALRVPDHQELAPWHFIEISGDGLERLGELFAKADYQANPHIDDGSLNAARKKPKRAPMIIAVIARITPDLAKVPPVEQILSAGCAAHAMLYAAYAQGLGAMWRTGGYAHDKTVWRGLGLGEHDELIGFLYLGQPGGRYPEPPLRHPDDFVERWN